MSDPYASLPDDHDEPDHWVLDLPDDQIDIACDFYRDETGSGRPLRLRPFGVFDEVSGLRTLN
ncbi:hypothetical protein [Actinoplanes sp. NPDC049265]|uniref:hypothetical protein n=1 Tax=Actinoplanes sp. NPDC049265 TaxID=3363902 RepID=UPI003714BE18